MAAGGRSINFGVNISIRELGRIAALAKELEAFASSSKAAATGLAAINQAGGEIKSGNIDKASEAFFKISAAIERLKATGSTAGIGRINQEIKQTGESTEKVKTRISNLANELANLGKVASKASTSKLADEELKKAKSRISSVRAAQGKLENNLQKLLSVRRRLTEADKTGEVVQQKLINKAQGMVEAFRLSNATQFKNIKLLYKSGFAAEQLGVDVKNIAENYRITAKEVAKVNSKIKVLSKTAQERLNLEKQVAITIKDATRTQINAAKRLEQSQKNLNKEKIKAIELTGKVAQLEKERARAAQQRTTLAQAPVGTFGAGTSGAEAQKKSVEAATQALAAYDNRIKSSKALIESHNQVQRASAQVALKTAAVHNTAAMEVRAAQNLIAQGYSKAAQKQLKAAQQSKILAQQELEQARKTLSARQQAFKRSVASAKVYDNVQKDQIKTSQGVIKAQEKQIGFLGKLNEGFTRVIRTQLLYFASTILIFGAIAKLKVAFTSLIELSDRTARAFAVSRSSVLLFEERFVALQNAIETTAAVTGISINDVSEAVFQFGSAGLQAEESIAALESTMNLIQATGADVTNTTKTIAATYRLLGGQLEDVGDQTAQFARINDIIAATYRDNQVEIGDFTQAMKFALPVSRQLNLTLEQTSGIVALLHNNFIRGGMSGRALRVIFSRMSKEMDQFAESFGVAIDPDKPLDFLDVMEQISKRMQTGAVTAEQISVVFERFGLRGANAVIVLTKQFDELKKTIDKLENSSAGAAETMALIHRKKAVGQLKVFTENMLRLGRAAIEPLAFIILKVVRAINIFAESIRNTGLEKILGYLVRLVSIFIMLKIVTLLYGLAMTKLGTATATTALFTVKGAVAMGWYGTALKMSAANALITAKSIFSLKVALISMATTAKAAGAALIAAFPYLFIATLIAGIIYIIYRLITAQERLIETNNERLDQIREEKKEIDGRLASYDATIAKLEEVNQAYKESRTTLLETRKAISEAVGAHGELGVAAAVSGDDIDLFIDKTRKQRAEIQALLDTRKEEEKEAFEENIKVYADRIDDAAASFAKLRSQIERGVEFKKYWDPDALMFFTGEVKVGEQRLKEMREELAKYQKTARTSALDIFKLSKSNGELAKAFGITISRVFTLAASLNASAESAKTFGDVLKYLRDTAENLSELPLEEKIDKLGKTVSGLEGLRLKFLFEYDFIIPKENIEIAKRKIQDAIDKINLLTESDREIKIALLYGEEDFALNVEHAKKNADELANTFNATLKDVTKKLELTQYLTIDDEQIITLFESVSENAELTKKGYEESSKEAAKFAENNKKIESIQRSILSQAQFYSENKNDLKIIVEGINALFGDQVKLHETLVVLQQRQVAAATAFDLQLNEEIKLLQRTRNISQDTTQNTKDQVDATRVQVTQTGILYRGHVANEEAVRNNLKLIKESNKESGGGILRKIKNMRAEKKVSTELKNVEGLRGETLERHRKSLEGHAKALLAQANWTHQLNLEVIKGEDARNKVINYGQDRVSQIRAELLNQQKIIKEEKRYLKDLMSKKIIAQDQRILDAKDAQLKAKTFDLDRKKTEELFKQNFALLKSVQLFDSTLASNSKLLKTSQDVLAIDTKLVKETKHYNKLIEKVKKGKDEEKRFDRERLVTLGKIVNLAAKRTQSVIKALKAEAEVNNKYLEQVNSIQEMNLELENNKEVKDQILISSLEEEIALNKIAQIQNEINVIEKERALDGKDEVARKFKLNDLYHQQKDIIKSEIIQAEKKLQNVREHQATIIKSINNLYGKQLENISAIGDVLEEAFKPLVAFDFDQRPFTSAIFASKALGKSLLEIAQLSPQQVINELNRGLREGSVDFKLFTGHARELAQNIARIGAEERALRSVQEDIRKQQFATNVLRIERALKSGVKDVDAAEKAYNKLNESFQVLNLITGKVDPSATRENLLIMERLAARIATEYDKSGNVIQKNLTNLHTKLNEMLGDIQRITTEIAKELEKTKFADVFFEQMSSIIRQLKALDGTTIEFKIDDITAQLARMNIYVPATIQKQEGGFISGSGRGDIVPAMLEPGEFVIPKNVVDKFGVEFFERLRRPNTVDKISTLEGINNVQKFRTGGLVGVQGFQDGGEVTAIEFSVQEVIKAFNTIEFSAQEVAKALNTIEFTEIEVVSALNEVVFAEEEVTAMLRDLIEAKQLIAQMGGEERFGPGRMEALLAGPIEVFREIAQMYRESDIEDVVEAAFANVVIETSPNFEAIVDEAFANMTVTDNLNTDKMIAKSQEIKTLIAQIKEQDRIAPGDEERWMSFSLEYLKEMASLPEKLDLLAKIGKEQIGPEKRQELLALPVEELRELAQSFKKVPLIDISDETKELLAQQDIQINLIYEDQFNVLKKALASLDPTNIRLAFSETGLDVIISKTKEAQIPQEMFADVPGALGGQQPRGRQTGGFVSGIGSGDIIPAMLEPGEFVIPRNVVDKLGVNFFNNLIHVEKTEGYKFGGIVGYQEGGVAAEEQNIVYMSDPITSSMLALGDIIVKSIEGYGALGTVIKDTIGKSIEGYEALGTVIKDTVLQFGESDKLLGEQELQMAESLFDNLEDEFSIFRQHGEFDIEKLSKESPELVSAICDIKNVIYNYQTAEERTILLTRERATQLEDILTSNKALANTMYKFNEDLQLLRESSGDVTRANKGLIGVIEASVAKEIPNIANIGMLQVSEDISKQIEKKIGQEISPNVVILTANKVEFERQPIPERAIATVPGFQIGGPVPGIGSGDIVPAMLEPGEFVIRKDIVEKLGLGFFKDLNKFRMGGVVGLQDGGVVTASPISFVNSEIEIFGNTLSVINEKFKSFGEILDKILFSAEKIPTEEPLPSSKESVSVIPEINEEGLMNLSKAVMETVFPAAMEPFVEQAKAASEEFDKIAEDTKNIAEDTKEIEKNIESEEFQKIAVELEKAKTLNVDFVNKLKELANVSKKDIDISKWGALVELARELKIDPLIILQMEQIAVETDSTSVAMNKLTQESGNYFSQIKDIIAGVGKGTIPAGRAIAGVRAIISKFKSEVSNANKEVVEFAEALLSAFGPKLRAAIQSTVKLFKDVFGRILPGLFGGFLDSFIKTQVDIVAGANEAAKNTSDSFLDARADLVESLKRNEISYFDYFNKLEDLNKDTSDNMADAAIQAEEDRVEAVGDAIVGLTSTIMDEISKWIDGFDDFFGRIIDGFVDIGVGIADSLGEVGALIGQIVEVGIGALGAAGGAIGGGGIAAAVGAAAGSVVPGVGTAIGGAAGVAIGAIVGGAVGSVLKTAIPIVGDIIKAFEQMASAAIKGILDIIPYIIELGAMRKEEFEALVGYTDESGEYIKGVLELLPGDIETFTTQFAERLPIIVEKFEELLPDIITALVGGVNSAERMLEGAIPTVFRVITENLEKIIDLAIPQFFRFFNSVLDSLPNLFTSIFNSIVSSARKILSGDQLTVLFQNIVDTITEIFTSFAKDFAQPLSEALKENLPTIITSMTDTLVDAIPILTDAMVMIIDAMISVLSDPAIQAAIRRAIFALLGAMSDAFRELFPIYTAIQNFVTFLGNIVNLYFLPLIIAIGLVVGPLIASAAALIIIVGIIGGIVLKPIIDIFTFFADVIKAVSEKLKESEKIKESIAKIQKAFDRIGKAFSRLFAAFSPDKANPELINDIADAIVYLIENGLMLLVPVIELVADGLVWLIEKYTEAIESSGDLIHVYDLFVNIFQTIKDNIPYLEELREVMRLLGELIETILIAAFNNIMAAINNVIDAWNDFVEFVDLILSPIFSVLEEVWQNFVDWVSDIVSPVLDPVMEAWQNFVDFIDNTVIAAFDNLKQIIQTIINLIPGVDTGDTDDTTTSDNRFVEAGNRFAEGDILGGFGAIITGKHQGGIFSTPTDPNSLMFADMLGLRMDEGLALLLEGEGILTQAGVEAIGGEKTIKQINEGKNPFTGEQNFDTMQFDELELDIPPWMLEGFHQGGIFNVPTDPNSRAFYEMLGLHSNEGLALLLDGEGILTRNGVEAIGGASAIAQFNDGENPYAADMPDMPHKSPKAAKAAAEAAAKAAAKAEAKAEAKAAAQMSSASSYDSDNIDNGYGSDNVGVSGQTRADTGVGTYDTGMSTTQKTNIEVNIDMSGSQFQSETIADDVEEQIVGSMQNQEGAMYEEIDTKYGNDTMSGVKRR